MDNVIVDCHYKYILKVSWAPPKKLILWLDWMDVEEKTEAINGYLGLKNIT